MQKINTVWWRGADHEFTDRVTPGCEWVVMGAGFATEKLNGTNVMVYFHAGDIFTVHKRRNPSKKEKAFDIQPHNVPAERTDPNDKWIFEAVDNWIDTSHFYPHGAIWGEAIGPKIQGNQYELSEHIWIPFLPEFMIEVGVPRDFQGMKDCLVNHGSVMFPGCPMEGVVFRWPWGMAKAKGKDF